MRPTRIILIRHGEAEGNVDERLFETKADHQMALHRFSTALDYAVAATLPQEYGRALEGKARTFSLLGDVAEVAHLHAVLVVAAAVLGVVSALLLVAKGYERFEGFLEGHGAGV